MTVGPTADVAGLRVLAFCDYFPPGATGGGAERVALEVYRRLAECGASVTVVAAGGQPGGTVDGVEVLPCAGVDLTSLVGAQVMVAPAAVPRALLSVRARRPHVLHANSIHFNTSVAAAVAARLTRVPLVTTAHVGAIDFLPPRVRVATAAYEQTAGRFVLRSSARVVAVSADVAARMQSLGVPRHRVEVIPNGVDVARFSSAAALTEPRRVLFIGRLIANKGPAVLLEALGELRGRGVQFRAEFVGDGPLRSELERRTAQLGLGGHVRFVGYSARVEDHLRGAAVVARPSLTEGMPLTVLEAFAARVPVVASDLPANRELIDDGVTGMLVPPDAVVPLADSVQALLADPAKGARMAAAAYTTVVPRSWDACAQRTASVLSRVARSPAVVRP